MLLLPSVAILILGGCILPTATGSGRVVSEARDVADFTSVSFGGIGQLLLTQGEEESLTIWADDNLMEHVKSEVRGSTLHIGTKGSVSPSQPIRFRVQVRNLVALDVAGRGHAQTGEIVTEELDVAVSGFSTVRIDSLHATNLSARLSGSTELEMRHAGEVEVQDVSLSGSNRYSAPFLQSRRARITISGSGHTTVWATELLDVMVSGNGEVSYYGHPEVGQEGSGSVSLRALGDRPRSTLSAVSPGPGGRLPTNP